MFEPPPHPDTECPFYRGAYQNFLIATQPLPDGDPILVDYPTIDDAFHTAYPTGFARNSGPAPGTNMSDPCENPGGFAAAAVVHKGAATGKAWLGAIRQAGQRNILVDQDRHTLFYGLHMNQAFVDFVRTNNLGTVAGILLVPPALEFPPGVVEFKTAWKDIDPRDFPDSSQKLCGAGIVPKSTDFESDPGDYSNYITTMAWIPWVSQDPSTHQIIEDPDHPVLRKMALVAVHSVYTLPGHPEFVWGSIQHVNIHEPDPAVQAFANVTVMGMPDSQPNATGPDGGASLPDPMDVQNLRVTTPPDSQHRYLLYAAKELEKNSNLAVQSAALTLDEASQSFVGTNDVTNVYRVFPGSKANTLQPDTAVFSLNSNINVLFAAAIDAGAIDPGVDKRQNYRLVAAVWMDKPALFGLGVQDPQTHLYSGMPLQNDDSNPLVADVVDETANGGHGPFPLKAKPNVHPEISQGVSCGTPNPNMPMSGDVPGATAFNNSVPQCDTRYDDLDLPDAGNPQFEPEGGPLDPSFDFDLDTQTGGTDSPFSILGGRIVSRARRWRRSLRTTRSTTASHATTPSPSGPTASARTLRVSRPAPLPGASPVSFPSPRRST
jgi:hypothetical protein